LKILQINASYKPAFIYGGPTMSVSMLSEQLVKAGESVNVFTTTANGNAELPAKTETVDGVTVTYFKRLTKDHTHFSPALLANTWRRAKDYDIVHIHAWWNLVSVLSCLAAIMRGVPVVLSPRGTLSSYSFNNKNSFIKNLIHRCLGLPLLKRSYIHTTSAIELAAIKSIGATKNICNIPNFIKLGKLNQYVDDKPDASLKLIFFSRIEEKKGLDILLNALKTVTIPYTLTIAGGGDDSYIDQLKKLAAENNIADKISWIGFQGADKFDLLAKHDLMILPSHDENFGNVVIESLSVGTAVLISENVGLADYVAENNMGWICQTNAASLSDAINRIGNHNPELKNIREFAPAKVRDDFNEDNLVKKYIEMYNTIIKS